MTAITERLDLDAITAQARDVRFWRTVLTAVAGVLFGVGWVVAKAFGVVWLASAWVFVAVRAGYREGRGARVPSGPSVPR
jgi:hypothetical protein